MAVGALAALAVALPGAGADAPTLRGTVGPGFTISLLDAGGKPVTRLDPGAYTVAVSDLSPIHNFHLVGPGLDMKTGVEETGQATWSVTLVAGTYRFFCDPHATTMKGEVTVGAPVASPPPPPPPSPPAATRLNATVGPGAKISLKTRSGIAVTGIAPGVYVIVVRDLSARDNFHLIGPGVNRKTGLAGKGVFTWRVKLVEGTYRYRSDARPAKLRGSFLVRPEKPVEDGGY